MLIGHDLVDQAIKKVKTIYERLKIVQSQHK